MNRTIPDRVILKLRVLTSGARDLASCIPAIAVLAFAKFDE